MVSEWRVNDRGVERTTWMRRMYGSNNGSVLAGIGLVVVARRMRNGVRIAPSERGDLRGRKGLRRWLRKKCMWRLIKVKRRGY